jgi:hypothetical protein
MRFYQCFLIKNVKNNIVRCAFIYNSRASIDKAKFLKQSVVKNIQINMNSNVDASSIGKSYFSS